MRNGKKKFQTIIKFIVKHLLTGQKGKHDNFPKNLSKCDLFVQFIAIYLLETMKYIEYISDQIRVAKRADLSINVPTLSFHTLTHSLTYSLS